MKIDKSSELTPHLKSLYQKSNKAKKHSATRDDNAFLHLDNNVFILYARISNTNNERQANNF